MYRMWTPALAVGEPGIDHQHRELFRRTADLAEALAHGEGTKRVADLIEYMGAYTFSHFMDEEYLMESEGYPGLAAHKGLHRVFLAEMRAERAKYDEKGVAPGQAVSFYRRVCDWLTAHISVHDKAFARWRSAATEPSWRPEQLAAKALSRRT